MKYKENPYKIGDKVYFKAWWRKDELILCEVIEVYESQKYSSWPDHYFPPSVLVRPLEGNPHIRCISLKELIKEDE